MMKFLTIKELLERHPLGKRGEGQIYKFVRLPGQNYRFGSVYFDHCQMVSPEEKPETAGMLLLTENNWKLIGHDSQTLKLHVDSQDENWLTELLGRPARVF